MAAARGNFASAGQGQVLELCSTHPGQGWGLKPSCAAGAETAPRSLSIFH